MNATHITYLEGDATSPQHDGPKVITHVCNDRGGWGAGFVMAISLRWPQPENEYRRWQQRGKMGDVEFELGAIQIVAVATKLWVCNMVAQEGFGEDVKPPIRYREVAKCLKSLAARIRQIEHPCYRASIHMPRIGCGLAGGVWKEIEPLIIEATLGDVRHEAIPVFVYDLPTRK